MKQKIRLNESDLSKLIIKIIKEQARQQQIYRDDDPRKFKTQKPQTDPNRNYVKNISFDSLWANFPKKSSAEDLFPNIFPTDYKKTPSTFGNACATRLSLALNNLGIRPKREYKTEVDFTYDGVTYKKESPITTSAWATHQYLTARLGKPTYTMKNTEENVDKYLVGKQAIFVITENPNWEASGHVDIVDYTDGYKKCGYSCHLGAGGKLQAWVFA